MLKAGLIEKEYRGHYRIKPRHGMGSPPRLQNLLVVADKSKNPELRGRVSRHLEIVKEFPSLPGEVFRVRLIYGEKRDKIHWTVKAPLGLDYYAFLMTRAWVESDVENRVGLRDLIWDVKSYELLWDSLGIRLEGVSVVTLDDLEGTLEKYYNKFYGVRKEVRQSPEAAKFDEMVSLMMGGVPTYQMTNQLAILTSQMEELTRHLVGMIDVGQANRRLLEALTNEVIKLKEGRQT
jgi:hypothetical protein